MKSIIMHSLLKRKSNDFKSPQLYWMTYYFMHVNGYLNNLDGIRIGVGKPKNMPLATQRFLNFWTKRIEDKINHVELFSPDYCTLIESRFISYSEFETLFESTIKEDEYMYYRAYEFFMLSTSLDKMRLLNGVEKGYKGFMKLLSTAKSENKVFFENPIRMEIPLSSFKKHCHIVGRSGQGKSNLIKLLIKGLVQKSDSESIVLLDPHGDLSKEIRNLKTVLTTSERLVYIDPYYIEGYMPVINPFDIEWGNEHALDQYSQELSKTIVSLLKEGTTLTTQMEALLRPAISTLLTIPNATFEDLQILMSIEDTERRQEIILEGLTNPLPSHRRMFNYVWGQKQIPHSYKLTMTSIFTKIQSLLNTDVFFKLTCANSGKSTVNLNSEINLGKLILINLSKGSLGEEASEAFGKLVLSILQNAALRRSSVKKENRKQVYLFVDEFQNYIVKSIKTFLEESRKYKFSMVLSHQTIGQIDDSQIQDAVLGNTGVRIVGKSDKKTLRSMSEEMDMDIEDMSELEAFEFYVEAQNQEFLNLKVHPYRIKPYTYLLESNTEYYQTESEMQLVQKQQLGNYYISKEIASNTLPENSVEKDSNEDQNIAKKIGEGKKPKYSL